MITDEQKRHFKTFGFLHLRQLFSRDETDALIQEADELFAEERQGAPLPEDGLAIPQFVERRKVLTNVVEDDRIYRSAEKILGAGFVWAGSEGHITTNSEHPWHPDRPARRDRSDSEQELAYTRLKINLYFDPVTEKNGCLRVIPGSHRMPLHGEIEPDVRHQVGPTVNPFGVPGPEMPSVALESKPGDAILFNQSIWHAIFNGWAGRRYIALKFAARPETDAHLASLRYYGGNMFSPHDSWLDSESARIRGMVADLPGLTAKEVPAFVPFRSESLK